MATRDYTLGKGKVLFKPTGASAYVDLGNAPAFALNLTIDKLEHLSSRSGLSVKDLEVITKMGVGGSFTLDEPNAENLRMFVMATSADASSQAGAAIAAIDNIQLPVADALGKWYPLTQSTGGANSQSAFVADSQNAGTAVLSLHGTPGTHTLNVTTFYEIRVGLEGASGVATVQARGNGGAWSTTPIVLTNGASHNLTIGADVDTGLNFTVDAAANLRKGDIVTFTNTYSPATVTRVYNIDATPVVTDSFTLTVLAQGMVEGIEGVGNFQVDRKAGLVYINLDQTTPANPIADGDILLLTAKKLDGVKTTSAGATQTSLKGDLYFVGAPPQGRVIDVMGFCSLTPNGDFSLIGTDWMSMQFNVEFLEVAGVSGLIKVEDRGKVDL